LNRLRELIEGRSAAIFIALALGAFAVLSWLGLGLTFFSDEWAFIEGRSLADPATWWAPHNEHWSTIPVIIYRAIMELAGLRTYVPYLAVVHVLHVACCAAVFVLVRRRVGPYAALGTSIVALLLGAGFENLFWGFQTGFVGSTAAGLWALVALDDPPTPARRIALGALLLGGLACSGIGLVFLLIAGLVLLGRPAWRMSWAAVAIPAAAFGLWFVTVGQSGVGVHRSPLGPDLVAAVPVFVIGGFANAAGSALGVGPVLGGVAAAAAVAMAAWGAVKARHDLPLVALACALGLAFQYALIAVARAGVTEGQVNYSRYTYMAALLFIVIVADVAAGMRLPRARRPRIAVAVAAVVALELSLVWNVRLLVEGRQLFAERAMMTRALVTVALDPGLADKLDADRSLVLVPSPRSLRSITVRYGSPLSDVLAPDSVPSVTEDALADAVRRTAGGSSSD
jgi:hypothetical protein